MQTKARHFATERNLGTRSLTDDLFGKINDLGAI